MCYVLWHWAWHKLAASHFDILSRCAHHVHIYQKYPPPWGNHSSQHSPSLLGLWPGMGSLQHEDQQASTLQGWGFRCSRWRRVRRRGSSSHGWHCLSECSKGCCLAAAGRHIDSKSTFSHVLGSFNILMTMVMQTKTASMTKEWLGYMFESRATFISLSQVFSCWFS